MTPQYGTSIASGFLNRPLSIVPQGRKNFGLFLDLLAEFCLGFYPFFLESVTTSRFRRFYMLRGALFLFFVPVKSRCLGFPGSGIDTIDISQQEAQYLEYSH